MTPAELDAAGRAMYENNANRVKPSWEILGGRTKQVWKNYVLHEIKALDVQVEEETLDAMTHDAENLGLYDSSFDLVGRS